MCIISLYFLIIFYNFWVGPVYNFAITQELNQIRLILFKNYCWIIRLSIMRLTKELIDHYNIVIARK